MSEDLNDDLPDLSDDTKPATPPADDRDARARLAALERRQAIDDIRTTIGVDPQIAEQIHKIASDSHLTAHEAAAVLLERNPEAFGDRIAFGSAAFGSLTPRSFGREAKADDATKRRAFIAGLRGRDERLRGAYLDNLAGAHLAQAMGWEHKLLPIPEQ